MANTENCEQVQEKNWLVGISELIWIMFFYYVFYVC